MIPMMHIKRHIRMAGVIAGTAALGGLGVGPVSAAGGACLTGGACYGSVQAAVDAAPSGGTVRLAAGTFAGGITVSKAVNLAGAGAGRTVIRGGGPALTITAPAAGPRVAISGLTISGGVAHGDDGVNAFGGGVFIPPAPENAVGATVLLRDVVVAGNRTDPTRTSPSPSGVKCPDGDCPYAGTRGGGIASFGSLRLVHSVVSGNGAAGRASDAVGGGIFSAIGSLTLDSSDVVGNGAVPGAIGRFAEGGGIFADSGFLTIRDSTVRGNRADLVTSWPANPQGVLLDMNANSGGIHIGDGLEVLIERTAIKDNSIRAVDAVGEPLAFDAGLLAGESHLVMRQSVISGNATTAVVATTEDTGPAGNALEVDGAAEIGDTRISDNPVTVFSKDGQAAASAGLAVLDSTDTPDQVTLSRVVISGNVATARSRTGSAVTTGGGVLNNGLLELRNVDVRGNQGVARAPEASAQGGGIWNGVFLSGPPVVLALHHTRVVQNVLTVSTGGTAQGGGLFTTEPVTRDDAVIARNTPDQCFGCTANPALSATTLSTTPSTSQLVQGHQAGRTRQHAS